MADERASDVVVAVVDVDQPRLRAVRGLGDRAHERRMLDERIDEHGLAGLDVRPDANDQLRVALEQVRGHRRRIESWISCVERRLVPRGARAREPDEGMMPLGRERVRLGLLGGRQVPVAAPVGTEVAARRRRQQAVVVAAHRGRRDELVELA